MKSFEEALGELVGRYKDADLEEMISALEIQMYALRDDLEAKKGDEG